VTVHHAELRLRTARSIQTVDITDRIVKAVDATGIASGICVVTSTHTTAGIFVNENADPDVQHDLLAALARIVPDDAGYRHAEGNSPAHLKAILTGADCTVVIAGGQLALGRWQGVFFAEFDGPRDRVIRVAVMGEPAG